MIVNRIKASSFVVSSILVAMSTVISPSVYADEINGTSAGETINGTAVADTISGRGGDDVIFGSSGDDIIYGDRGHDSLHGDEGDDQLYGGLGDDSLDGGFGDDRLVGGDGADTYIVKPLATATTDNSANFQLVVENENSTPAADYDIDVLELDVDLGVEGAKVVFWGLTVGAQNLEIDYYENANNTDEDDPQYLEVKVTEWWANQQFPYYYGDPLKGIDIFRVLIDGVNYDVSSLNLFCLFGAVGSSGQSGRLTTGDVLAQYWSGEVAMPGFCGNYPVTLTQN